MTLYEDTWSKFRNSSSIFVILLEEILNVQWISFNSSSTSHWRQCFHLGLFPNKSFFCLHIFILWARQFSISTTLSSIVFYYAPFSYRCDVFEKAQIESEVEKRHQNWLWNVEGVDGCENEENFVMISAGTGWIKLKVVDRVYLD